MGGAPLLGLCDALRSTETDTLRLKRDVGKQQSKRRGGEGRGTVAAERGGVGAGVGGGQGRRP